MVWEYRGIFESIRVFFGYFCVQFKRLGVFRSLIVMKDFLRRRIWDFSFIDFKNKVYGLIKLSFRRCFYREVKEGDKSRGFFKQKRFFRSRVILSFIILVFIKKVLVDKGRDGGEWFSLVFFKSFYVFLFLVVFLAWFLGQGYFFKEK